MSAVPTTDEHLLILYAIHAGSISALLRRNVTADTFCAPDVKKAWKYLVDSAPSGTGLPGFPLFYRKFPGFPTLLQAPASPAQALADLDALLKQVVSSTLQVRTAQVMQEALGSIAAGGDPHAVHQRALARLEAIRPAHGGSPMLLVSAGQSIREEYDRRERSKGVTGVPFAFNALNRCFGGKQSECVIVVTGHTGSGKSWFIHNEAYTDWLNGYRVLLVLGEMTKLQSATRIATRIMRISARDFNRGTLSPEDRAKLEDLENRVSAEMSSPTGRGVRSLQIMGRQDGRDGNPPTVQQVCAEARRWGADVVYYDSVYKSVQSTDPKDQARVASDALSMSATLGIPVIVSNQTNNLGAAAYSTMYERDAAGIINVAVGDDPGGTGKMMAVEVVKVREEGDFCPPFGVTFNPGVTMDEQGPIDLALFRKARQEAEQNRGRYVQQAVSGRAAPGAAATPARPAVVRPGPIRE